MYTLTLKQENGPFFSVPCFVELSGGKIMHYENKQEKKKAIQEKKRRQEQRDQKRNWS